MPKSQKIVRTKTELVKSTTGSNWHFLIFPNQVVKKIEFEGKFRRVICSMNGDEGFQCALLPWGELFYIIVNKKRREVLGLEAGDIVRVELVKDESKYGLPMPEELREVLDQDPEGDRLFHALTEGKQRTMLYYIGKWKDIDRRIHYALTVIEHLKQNDGKIVFKELGDELKRPVFDI